ncbi:MAG: peptidoglycan DD-metalloendopeptidase family protein [Bdellovibrionota bacterium]
MILLLLLILALTQQTAMAGGLAEQLGALRSRVISIEEELLNGLKNQAQARFNMKKIQVLIKLQKEERILGKKRLVELENTIAELEARTITLGKKIAEHQQSARHFLVAVDRSIRQPLTLFNMEKTESPHRRVMVNLADHGIKEIDALRVDLIDSEKLEAQIQEEKQQLVYLLQDLDEQESVLELNRRLQADILAKRHEERVSQLFNYRKLKDAESRVERLISDFNARRELEQAVETEQSTSAAVSHSLFSKLRGKLLMPVKDGRITSSFGGVFDTKSNLYVFKKGIDITVSAKSLVQPVSAGKVAYAGDLPNYGKVMIVDHGNHFYSLYAQLGEFNKKVGDQVAIGDKIGVTDESGIPLYFELRARNVAVNPLQWFVN